MTVAELLARVSSKELTEWMAFDRLEPFGTNTQYLGPAITSSVVANVNRPKSKKAMKPEDFMPKFKKKKKQTTGDMIGIAAHLTAALGGEDLRDK